MPASRGGFGCRLLPSDSKKRIDAGLVIVGLSDAPFAWPGSLALETWNMRFFDVFHMPRMTTSVAPLWSFGTRSVASVAKAMYSPLSFDAWWNDAPLPA